jgi:TatD DNase family protein
MIDSHAHLDAAQFASDRNAVIERCRDKLHSVINVGVDIASSRESIRLSNEFDFIFAAVGIHPEEVDKNSFVNDRKTIVDQLEVLISQTPNKVVAVGEIGVDKHHLPDGQTAQVTNQVELFRAQIELAIEHRLPVIIHSRDAFSETFSVLKEYQGTPYFSGVWHSFTGSREEASQILGLGLYIGLNGIITFTSTHPLRQVVVELPLDKIIVETDAPYLAPQKMRGQRNEPWMVGEVIHEIAKMHQASLGNLEKQFDENARRLFKL